jgi:hypothetical protein
MAGNLFVMTVEKALFGSYCFQDARIEAANEDA